MTHPDPYIEEVIIKLDELLERASCACDGRLPHGVHYVLADVNHGKDGEEIRDLLRTALEAQQSALKTQRIKDIEEIGLAVTNKFVLLRQNEQVMSERLFKDIHTILTSRKAAIEEQ